MPVNITFDISLPAVPNFPNGGLDYEQRYQNELNNILRLYLERLRAGLQGIATGDIPIALELPYFSAYQNGNTTLTSGITNTSTTPIPVTSTAEFESSGFLIIEQEIIQYTGKTTTTFTGITRGVKSTTNVAHSSGVAVSEAAGVSAGSSAPAILDAISLSSKITCTAPDSKVYFTNDGIYNIQFSAQLLNWSNSEDNVTFWVRKNGTDIPYSAGINQVNPKHGSSPGATIVGWNYVEQFAAGDYFELYWTSDSGNTVLATYPAGTSPVHPVSPSLIMTIQYASGIV